MLLNPNIVTTPNSRYQNAFFEVFVMSMVTVWTPSKLLGYLTPFLGIILFILRSNSGKTLIRFVFLMLIYAAIVCFYNLFYYLVEEPFIIQNSILSFLTYGSFLFFLVLPSEMNFDRTNYTKYLLVIKVVILTESLLGIFQIVTYSILNGGNLDSATGDIVQGTLNPLSFINPLSNFNNQIYTTNLLLLLLFYTPYAIMQKKGIWICVIGFVALILASIWHLFIAFLLAFAFVSVYFGLFLKKLNISRVIIVFILILVISLSILTQPKNFSLISHYFEKLTSGQSPKATVAANSVVDLPKDFPWVYTIGLGPGQYSSRASLIGTGRYFGDFNNPEEMPLLEPNSSRAFKKYVYPLWREVATNVPLYGNSTMARPFFSVLSILTEFGYIVFFILCMYLVVLMKRVKGAFKRAVIEKNSLKSSYAYSCGILVVFLIIFSFFENYLEVTQAIFPGLLIFKFFYTFSKRI